MRIAQALVSGCFVAALASFGACAQFSSGMPLEEKRKFAEFVIDTSGQKEDTLRQTRAVYEILRRIES